MNHKNKHLVVQADREIIAPNLAVSLVAALVCYAGWPLYIFFDIYLFIFQNVYFRAFQIPLLKRSDFVIIDRQKLSQLTFSQKLNCVYCGYANGIAAYLKAVTNQMETYSCAIKHTFDNKATNHQKNFFEYNTYK